MESSHSQQPCPSCQHEPWDGKCGHPFMERNRYFDGKLMVARDFTDEQRYVRSLSMTHNHYLHDWGIACGLETDAHPGPLCRPNWIVVRQGLALDCCGRQLYLAKDTPVELGLPLPPAADAEAPPAWERFLAIRYCETPVEYLPALYADPTCSDLGKEASRVREGAIIELLEPHLVSGECWPREDMDEHPAEDGVRVPETDPSYWDPVTVHEGATPGQRVTERRPHGRTPDCPCECVCGDHLILARLTWTAEGGLVIDTRHRRVIPTTPGRLAKILHINWPHGGEMSVSELEDRDGRLEVIFSHPIREATGGAIGINEHTFQVHYTEAQRGQEVLDHPVDTPPALDGSYKAVYSIDPRFYTRPNRNSLVASTIWVTLRCDFIMDDQNNPVDGDFLRGELPTGNGIPGGTFTSWFRIV